MRYSFNQNKAGMVFAHMKDVNASFKDLGAVCDAIRYKRVPIAIEILDDTIINEMPILYRTHNKYMGSRHELGGRKGRTPKRCAALVRKVLVNAAANARNKGLEPDEMFVVHAAANKTIIAKRGPPKGALFTQSGIYGYQPARSMNLELAKIEIGLSPNNESTLHKNAAEFVKWSIAGEKRRPKKKVVAKPTGTPAKPAKRALIQKVEPKEKEPAKVAPSKPAEPAKVEKKESAVMNETNKANQ